MLNLKNILIIAITPFIALFFIVYYLIKYEKKSSLLLLKLFFYGFLVALPVVFFEKVLMSFDAFPEYISHLYKALIVAGITEEFFKRFVLISLAYNDKYFNKKFDGIVYSVITALGFATLENILCFIFDYEGYSIDIERALISVPGHILFAITMGSYLSLAKFAQVKSKKQYYFVLSLVAPIILHGIFDFLIYVRAFIFIPVFLVFLAFLNILNVRKLKGFYYSEEKESN